MKKLKILLVLQTPWGTDFGMSKVHYDLKKEYEKLGHEVDYLDSNKLYPRGQSIFTRIFEAGYQNRILAYLKRHSNKYDIIDANINCIPFSKESYSFKGVVLNRSHGLQPLYRQIEQSAVYKKMENLIDVKRLPIKTRIGNLYRFLHTVDTDYELFSSLKHADVIHALNTTELKYYREYGFAEEKLFLVPNGIPDEQVAINIEKDKLIKRKTSIGFIGSWTVRKGIHDLNKIVCELTKYIQLEGIHILGSGGSKESVYALFDTEYHSLLHVVPHFSQDDLPDLLSQVKVGIFPSYVEGFGLAILEQLARGIPVVAYDTPGPTGILEEVDTNFLMQRGDVNAIARRVVDICNMQEVEYERLVTKCLERAEYFRMSKVAKQFISVYENTLAKIK